MHISSQELRQELLKISGFEDEALALKSMGFDPDSIDAVEPLTAWYRSGSETYSLKFRVTSQATKETQLLIKACVAFSANSSVEAILAKWIDRRHFLERNGVTVPRLYAVGAGCLIEEYLTTSFKDAALLPGSQLEAISSAFEVAGIVDGTKFNPVDGFSDGRVKGDKFVMVDFGSDLGEPDTNETGVELAKRNLQGLLARWGASLDNHQEIELMRSYNNALASTLEGAASKPRST